MYDRRTFLGALALAPLLTAGLRSASHAAANQVDGADLARVEGYLNGIQSLEAKFTQFAPDGSLSSGRLYLRRPGRIRFEYDPPVPILVVADGVWVVYHDKELNQTTRVPLGSTPLSILVRDTIKFGGEVAVKRIERSPGALRVSLYDPAKPKDGQLMLVFSDQPLTLHKWTLTDAQGQDTTVSLDQVQTNVDLKNTLFVFHDPSPRMREIQ
ncbi:MAG TPA: outer membrane lipoprotein carrier protein LolA [Candidatus Cybelea sp.]|nr:outer membrane lipoprotein carrier protein LolA [Candidatus Cybelea sp.]